jgi:hypothetical protein
MTTSSGLQSWRTSYEINPIIFVGGIAGTPGQMIPISNFLGAGSAAAATNSIITSPTITAPGGSTAFFTNQVSLDDYFAHFFVLTGAQLIVNEFAHYPFLNQTVAANAIITQPLKLSVRMVAPVNGTNQSYSDKLSIMTGLKSTLDRHLTLGGTFNVATPSYIYTGCLLESLEDISAQGETEQLQFEWQWNFEQPLLTLQQIANTQNSLMANITNQTPPTSTINPNPSVAVAAVPTNAPSVAGNVSPIPSTGASQGPSEVFSFGPSETP